MTSMNDQRQRLLTAALKEWTPTKADVVIDYGHCTTGSIDCHIRVYKYEGMLHVARFFFLTNPSRWFCSVDVAERLAEEVTA